MRSILMFILTFPALVAAQPKVVICRDGKPAASIILSAKATLAEKTAAAELAAYLEKITGASFPVGAGLALPSDSSKIYLGPTSFATANGIDSQKLGSEEWIIRTVGKDLILTGGWPRGTLYAVYHFLEDHLGVRWWTPFEEYVPAKKTIEIKDLDLRGKPAFFYRDINMTFGPDYSRDEGRFCARNRLNSNGFYCPFSDAFGGRIDYGPPDRAHTFYRYLPDLGQTYREHPEWFPLVGGRRVCDEKNKFTQFCLTNRSLREYFLGRLRTFIAESQAEAVKNHRPLPAFYDISQNDSMGGWCQCDQCRAFFKREGSEAGLVVDFVNFLADGIKKEYPDIYLMTFAYQSTEPVPRTIKPRDNVIIRLTDTTSNELQSILHPDNINAKRNLENWSKIARNIILWDYAVTYYGAQAEASGVGLPFASAQTYKPDFQFFLKHHVMGVFVEHEYDLEADMKDFKTWFQARLLEDPSLDYDRLVEDFTGGFYGPAAPLIREYLHKLETVQNVSRSYVGWFSGAGQFKYLDLAFTREAMGIFDRAEVAVKNDPALLRRVRLARMPLDRAFLIRYPKLVAQWVDAGNSIEKFPLDRNKIAARYKDTWNTQAAFRRVDEKYRREVDGFVAATLKLNYYPLPERFKKIPVDRITDFPADQMKACSPFDPKLQPDKDAAIGLAIRTDLSKINDLLTSYYKLPIAWGVYDAMTRKTQGGKPIEGKDLPGPGYHWYNMGTFRITPSTYGFFYGSWEVQFDVVAVADPARPDQLFDIWALIKFEGPYYLRDKAAPPDAISIQRVIVLKKTPTK